MSDKTELGKVLLRDVRLAFPNLFVPKPYLDGKPCLSGTFILDGKGSENEKLMRQAMRDVAVAKWGPQKADTEIKTLTANQKVCLKDGAMKADMQGFDGNMFVSASKASGVAKIIDDPEMGRIKIIEDTGQFYAGCRVHASVKVWAQANNYGKRINAELLAVMFSRDDERFGGGSPEPDADEFDDIGDFGADDGLV